MPSARAPHSDAPPDCPAPLCVDPALLVFDKPTGLLSVPGRGPDKQDCLAARAVVRWPDARVVHRLDMATSGLIVLARGPVAQRALGIAFAERAVHKRYVAVVDGWVADDEGEIDLPLAADWPNRPRQKVDHAAGKPSRTCWQVLDRDTGPDGAPRTRLALRPMTGRTHQLRVHLQAIGHPILGDTLYAEPPVQARAPRLWLHAQSLRLTHPITGLWMQFDAPAPF